MAGIILLFSVTDDIFSRLVVKNTPIYLKITVVNPITPRGGGAFEDPLILRYNDVFNFDFSIYILTDKI